MKQLYIKLKRARRSKRGAAMIIALMLVLVLTMLIAGTVMVTEVQLSASKSERDYERALMMAEAGINSYVNMLTNGAGTGTNAAYIPSIYAFNTATLGVAPTLAQFKTGIENGTYTLTRYPAGSQQGYFVGQVPGSATGSYYITSYGWSNGICRQVSILNTELGNFALFVNGGGSMKGSDSIIGNVGTNGNFKMSGAASITGSLALDDGSKLTGSGKGVSGGTTSSSTDLAYPTVEALALTDFPAATYAPGGLSYLQTSAGNDDAGLGAGIITTTVSGGIDTAADLSGTVTLTSKSGGANYYLTSIGAKGNATITFDNSLGPITIWMGPSGGSSTVDFSGNTTVVPTSSDPSKPVRLYSALNSTITVWGSSTFDIGIYNLNAGGTASVTLGGNGTINMDVITNTFTGGGNGTINYVRGFFAAPGSTLASGDWTELY